MPPSVVPAAWSSAIPHPTPWDEVAAAVRAGTLDPFKVYPWRTSKPVPVAASPLLRALGARPEVASLDAVRPVLDACLERGVSLYDLSKGQAKTGEWTLLAHVRDPARLGWWLDVGGDPCAPDHNHQPMWWAFVDAGQMGLLDVLRARAGWSRWACARDQDGGTVFQRWAWLDRPSGPAKPSSASLALRTLDWLTRHVPAPPDPLTNPALLLGSDHLVTFLDQALDGDDRTQAVWTKMLANPGRSSLDRMLVLWDRWVEAEALPDHLNGRRRTIFQQMRQTLEAAILASALPPSAPDDGTADRSARGGRHRL